MLEKHTMEHNFRKLAIWQRSKDLVVEVYKLTKKFPDSEKFGLLPQMQRCAVSVPSNISEGCGRGTPAQLKHYLNISFGSICELETQIIIAHELTYCEKEEMEKFCEEIAAIKKMMFRFKKTL